MNGHLLGKWSARTTLALGCSVSLSLAACTGVLGSGDADGSGAAEGRSSADPSESESTGEGILTDSDGNVTHYEPAGTPLARLTNDEFFKSAIDALGIAPDADGIAEARNTFTAEALVGGAPNDVKTQRLTQVAILGYTNLATAAADVFLAGAANQADLKATLGCDDSLEFLSCLTEFGERLMGRAYRRALTDEHRAQLNSSIERFEQVVHEQASDPAAFDVDLLRVKTVIRTVLISPDFLLLVEVGESEGLQTASPDEIASRLSYLLTGDPPDDELRTAASEGQLEDAASRLEQAQRLLAGDRGRARIQDAMMLWLGVNESLVEPESAGELAGFIGDWFENDRPFADFYEAPIPVERIDGSTTDEPVGVLGMNAFLRSHTFPPSPAFISRGVFVVERLLCGELPADIPAEAFESEEQLSDKEVFEVHDQAACATCHRLFDNYGAALQQFESETSFYAPGPTELGSGFELFEFEGISGVVDGPQDLGATLAASERAPRCMAELWYRTAMRRSLDPEKDDAVVIDVLMENWQASDDTSLRSLLLELVSSEQFAVFVP